MKKLLLGGAILGLSLACGGGGGGDTASTSVGTSSTSEDIYFDFNNASHLFYNSGTSGRLSKARLKPRESSFVDGTDKLFKITDDGFVLEVKVEKYKIAADGTVTKETYTVANSPVIIHNLNIYTYVGFGTDSLNIVDGFLIRNSDGLAMSMEGHGFPIKDNSFKNEPMVQMDSSGQMYYKNAATNPNGGAAIRTLMKLNVVNNTIQTEKLSADNEQVYHYIIDNVGNAIYEYALYSDPNTKGSKIRFKDGVTTSTPTDYNKAFKAPSGNILYSAIDNGYNFKEVVFNGNNAESVAYSDFTNAQNPPSSLAIDQGYVATIGDNVYFVSPADKKIFLVEKSNGTTGSDTLSQNFSSIDACDFNSEYVYVGGVDDGSNTRLLKLNPKDKSLTDEIDQNKYSTIKNITVNETNELTFIGNKNNTNILVQKKGNTLNEVTDTGSTEIQALTKVVK